MREGLRVGDLAALELDPQPVRFYPNSGGSPDTTLASQLLGFVTDDGQGRYGIEQFGQDLLLAGRRNGRLRTRPAATPLPTDRANRSS